MFADRQNGEICTRSESAILPQNKLSVFIGDLLTRSLPFMVDDVRRELKGQDLICRCRLDAPCHAESCSPWPISDGPRLGQTLLKFTVNRSKHNRYCEHHKKIESGPVNHHRSCFSASWKRPYGSYHRSQRRSRELPRQLSRG